MTAIRIQSVDAPLNSVRFLAPTVSLVRRAAALGMLGDDPVSRLGLPVVYRIARAASAEGVGQDAAAAILGVERQPSRPGQRLATLIARLDAALNDSPFPDRELRALLDVFDAEGLASLLGVSAVSLRRYGAGARTMPDIVAARSHVLALIVSDLAGGYNELGIRRWFERPRSQLGGASPRAFLGSDWDPGSPQAEQLRSLAAVVAGIGAAT